MRSVGLLTPRLVSVLVLVLEKESESLWTRIADARFGDAQDVDVDAHGPARGEERAGGVVGVWVLRRRARGAARAELVPGFVARLRFAHDDDRGGVAMLGLDDEPAPRRDRAPRERAESAPRERAERAPREPRERPERSRDLDDDRSRSVSRSSRTDCQLPGTKAFSRHSVSDMECQTDCLRGGLMVFLTILRSDMDWPSLTSIAAC